MGFAGGVDGIDAALVLVENLLPVGVAGGADLLGRVADVLGGAAVVVAVPHSADFGVAEPAVDAGDIVAGNFGSKANLGEHTPAS